MPHQPVHMLRTFVFIVCFLWPCNIICTSPIVDGPYSELDWDLLAGRSNLAAASIENYGVIFAGGQGQNSVTATAELYRNIPGGVSLPLSLGQARSRFAGVGIKDVA